jgi:hypothetical protein
MVLGEAGVWVNWLDCGTPDHWRTELGCSDLTFPTHLSVRLVAAGRGVSEDTFGQSFLNESGEGNYAYVYAAQVHSSKALNVVKEGDLLGYVIAHEMGHLLLGRDSHAAAGVMRARWEGAELRQAAHGQLSFTRVESERMRTRYLSAQARLQRTSLPTSGK